MTFLFVFVLGARKGKTQQHTKNIYMVNVFWRDSVRICFPSRPQYAILGAGIIGQTASFERRLRGAAQTPLALPYMFCILPGSGTWAG